jgi:uncharacterized protein with FMN-binding domain
MDQNTNTAKTIALVAAGLVIMGALLMFLFNSKGEETTVGDVAPVVPPQGEPLPPQGTSMEDGTLPENADPLATPPGVLPTVPTPDGGVAPAPAAPIMPGTSSMNSSYKDGVYTTVGDYRSPAGPEAITVKLTLKDGKIVDSVVTGESNESVSQKFMDGFAQNHKALVVGKSIDEVKLGVVSGSSLTPKGFNAAVEQIKKEAKS